MRRLQDVLSITGCVFLFLHLVYVGGLSTSVVFRYAPAIALLFFFLELVLYIPIKMKGPQEFE